MPFCPNCGRPLAQGEVCGCTSPYMNQPGAVPQGYPQQNSPGQDYQNLYQNSGQPGQPPKKGNGCLIAALILIPLSLMILAVLAAILIPAMIGYTRKAQSASANSAAKQYSRAILSALTELDAADADLHGSCVLSTFEGGSAQEMPYDTAALYREVMSYAVEVSEDYDFFALIEDGDVTYVAVWNDHDGIIGTYPQLSEPRSAYDCDFEPHNYTAGNEMTLVWDLYAAAQARAEAANELTQNGEET